MALRQPWALMYAVETRTQQCYYAARKMGILRTAVIQPWNMSVEMAFVSSPKLKLFMLIFYFSLSNHGKM